MTVSSEPVFLSYIKTNTTTTNTTTTTTTTTPAISQTIFSNGFSWLKCFVFWLKFHWSVFLKVQFTNFSITLDNVLAPNRWKDIIWTNAGPIHRCIYPAVGEMSEANIHKIYSRAKSDIWIKIFAICLLYQHLLPVCASYNLGYGIVHASPKFSKQNIQYLCHITSNTTD